MESYKNTAIKTIIADFPKVGEILEEYNIGCGPCTVGICQLKDILDIHTLPPEKEQELMARIEAVIYPERGGQAPVPATGVKQAAIPFEFSEPMQILVDEHVLIKRWLAVIPDLLDNIDLMSVEGEEIYRMGVDLIKSYADKLHHGKEEDILFTYFDDSAEIFQVIYEDHRVARNHVKNMVQAIQDKDSSSLRFHLSAYRDVLTEHIHKEDEILFPWLDRKLTEQQIGELAEKFQLQDSRISIEPEKYRKFVRELENRFNVM